MSLHTGQTFGCYEILTPLGAGGMGEVYRARDPRLGREVALKILPAAFTNDPERLARFEREARLLASLDHPNIGAIYGVEESNGVRALVLALIEGPTLADRIAQSSVPPTEAAQIALQIAEAFEYAHDRGVIHRDLKPANIKITPDGAVKVLDFGLAKAMEEEHHAAAAGENSVTRTLGATQPGIIMGTAAYLAPEQIKGKRADRRGDIWAFGVVLYEMLTGHLPFNGDSIGELLADVVKEEPKFDAIPSELHPLVVRCLMKDPRRRLQSFGEARLILEDPAGMSRPVPAAPASTSRRAGFAWVAGAVLLLAGVGFTWRAMRAPPSSPPLPMRFEIYPPTGVTLYDAPPAISPDGKSLAFIGRASGGVSRVYIRSLDTPEARVLPGTDGALYTFWAPNGLSLGFTSRIGFKRIDLAGGTPITLSSLPNGANSGAWNQNGDILFYPLTVGPLVLYRIAATGGPINPVTQLDENRGETSHRFPQFLPDGKRFLFYALTKDSAHNTVQLATLGSFTRRTVLEGSSSALFSRDASGDGWLFYVREATLFAQRFDEAAGILDGKPIGLVDRVSTSATNSMVANLAVAPGLLAVLSRQTQHPVKMRWMDRAGVVIGDLPEDAAGYNPALSPDGRLLAVDRIDPVTGVSAVWVTDLERSSATRLTLGHVDADEPVWSHDGNRIAFRSDRNGAIAIHAKDARGGGEEKVLSAGPLSPLDWSADEKSLLASSRMRGIQLLHLDGNSRFEPLTPAGTTGGALSPDGRFMAYQSAIYGASDLFVIALPPASGKWQVSAAQGLELAWRRDGKELFYRDPDGAFMAVEVQYSPSFSLGKPRRLFSAATHALSLYQRNSYAVTADGRHFLVTMEPESSPSAPIRVVLNWTGLLTR